MLCLSLFKSCGVCFLGGGGCCGCGCVLCIVDERIDSVKRIVGVESDLL